MNTPEPARVVDDPILRLRDTAAMIGLSEATITRKRDPSSTSFDPDFPTPYKLGRGSVGWRESELREWLESVKMPRPERAS